MKQKLLLFLAVLCVGFASAQTFAVDGINYAVIPSTTSVSVTNGSCYIGDLMLPSMVSDGVTNYTVTSVGDEAFRFCEGLTSISFPSTVTSIGSYSFAEAYNLTSIIMGINVTTLGEYAFADTSLKAVSLGSSVTSIGDGVFSGCRFLETITNFDAVVSIGDHAFDSCISLTSFTFPSSVTTVGSSLFEGCEALTSVTIGVNMTEIGDSTFSDCTNLTTITIPSNITTIGESAFSSSGLTSINIPNSISSIGYAAFSRCADLKSVTIPNSVTSIGDFAFSRCSSLELFVSKLSTPISIPQNTFNNIDLDVCVLVVPTGKTSEYSAALYWQDFTTITDVLPITPDANNTIYVNKNVSGGNNSGNSWSNAIPELATALNWAKDNPNPAWATTPLQVYVAVGTYYPTSVTTDRSTSFVLGPNIKIHGGFDPSNNIVALTDARILPTVTGSRGTILSGDVDSNDALKSPAPISGNLYGNNSGNSYHVVNASTANAKSLLDGLRISFGNANGNEDTQGGGIYANTESSQITITRSVISHNSANIGGGVFSKSSFLSLTNSMLSNNSANEAGGMFSSTSYSASSTTSITNSIVSFNAAASNGGGVYAVGSSSAIFNINNSLFASNTAPDGINYKASPAGYSIKNSYLEGQNLSSSNNNLNGVTIPITAVFKDAVNGDYTLKSTSHAVNAGNNSLYIGTLATDKDLAGNARLFDGSATTDVIDMGPYEFEEIIQKTDPTITFADLSKTYGDANFDLAAISNSTGLISYEIIAGGTGSATLSGTNNAIVTVGNIGTVLLKATVAEDANYNAESKTITLTINKATITGITFANASSVYDGTAKSLAIAGTLPTGTSVNYANNSRTNVGTQEVTATIDGANYTTLELKANLTITKADQQISWNQNLISYCGSSTPIVLTATSSSGLPISYTSSNSNVASISNNVLNFANYGSATITAVQSGNGNYNATSSVTLPVLNSQPNLLRKHFDNVIFFDNSSNSFRSYTWYKNGVVVAGQTAQYFTDSSALNGSYYAVATRIDGTVITTCPVSFSPSIEQEFIKVAPNPVRANSSYQLTTNLVASKLINARVTVISMLGAVITNSVVDKNSVELIAPSVEGIYIVKMTLSNGQYFTKNLLVKN